MPGGGGGADLDVVTAVAPDVAAGKVIVGPDGEPLTGTMPNRGNVSYVLPINGSYTIEAGQHGGGGQVTQSIATLGAQTIYPGTTAKTLSTTGKYCTGNVTVPAVSIAAAYIKKGQVITLPDGSTITGTWEGYVAAATDLYYNGANAAGLSRTDTDTYWTTTFESTFIRAVAKAQNNRMQLTANKSYQFAGYSAIQITIYSVGVAGQFAIELRDNANSVRVGDTIQSNIVKGGTFTMSIPLTTQQTSFVPRFDMRVYLTSSTYGEIQIQRIRLV